MDLHNPGSPAAKPQSRFSRWYVRIPLKWFLFLIVAFFVLFPNPLQFARHVSHLSDMNAMIKPDVPALGAWEQELDRYLKKPGELNSKLPGHNPWLPHKVSYGDDISVTQQEASSDNSTAYRIQSAIQNLVYDKVRYDWDWNVWNSADYMPSVEEMFAQASKDGEMREDCDGRAVMAASLMKRMGFEPSLVTDLRHVWVVTPEGEWMGPGRQKTIKSGTEGNRTAIMETLGNVPVALSYGLAVFPLWRELILLATAFGLMLRRGMSWRWVGLAALLLIQGLLFTRLGYLAPARVSREVAAWPTWVGGVHMMTGLGIILWSSYRARRLQRSDGNSA